MRDLPIIMSGLAAFMAVVTLPFWYNAVNGAGRLDLARPVSAKQCVAPTDVMRRSHMELLNVWRDRRVRDGIRTQAGYEIALTKTCLEQCHGNRVEFCDRCHAYVGLKDPDCWSCHGGPERIANPLQAAGLPYKGASK